MHTQRVFGDKPSVEYYECNLRHHVYLDKLSGMLSGVSLISMVDIAPGEELDRYIR